MTAYQRFDIKICCQNQCKHMRGGACFSNPDICKINNKAGYPKEIKEKIIVKFADAWKLYGTKNDWVHCRKKPIIIKAIQMEEDFEVATKEGLSLAGKQGDWLLEGVQGEVYPCNNQIFKQTYKIIKRG